MQPLISVIVPVYNTKAFLKKCVDSIIAQTYTNLEIILVDDGSFDGSSDICDEYQYKDPRVQVIHKENEGQSIARNYALSICTGEYVYFADSDDYLHVDLLSIMHTAIEKNNVDAAICNVSTSQNVYSKILIDEIGSQLWRFLFKRSLLEGFKLPENRYAEDAAIVYKVLYEKKIAVVEKELYFYNKDNPQSSSNRTDKYFKNSVDRAIMFIDRFEWMEDKFPLETVQVIMKKATCVSIGVVGLYKAFDYNQNDINKIVDFLKRQYSAIKKLDLGLGRKVALAIINYSPRTYYYIKNILKRR